MTGTDLLFASLVVVSLSLVGWLVATRTHPAGEAANYAVLAFANGISVGLYVTTRRPRR